ncbi:mfs multidrug [Lichtheimia corymbifera JMRC:FSU:9682]|uniref:Mfs multidrug n=1 Tax=Lichtheimia corymbifera JMRC:FSU:9682 TaxID=1263082 RepID=A0A068S913_9FUNG|nr:mfs multidrug [Lichtheimia corymbifera JMRC:FSU:9682]
MNFTVTIYIIAQAIAPAFWGPIADRTGRRPMYLMATLTFVLSCVGLALAPNYPVLLAMRLLQSFGASPTVAIVCGIIGDISPPSRRGTYFSIMSGVRHVVTTTAPMVGGIVAQKTSWRWIWWIMVISGGVIFALMLFFVPETLRSLVGNGSGYANPTPTQWWRHRNHAKQQRSSEEGYQSSSVEEEGASSITHIPTRQQRKAINPLKPLLFLKEWDVICALLFGGLCFGTQQCFLVTTSHILASVYKLSVMNVGLCFMTGGAGSLAGALSTGRIMDYEFKRVAIEACGHVPKRGNLSSEFPIFKARLRYPLCLAAILEAAVMVFGWSVYTVQPLPITLTIVFICNLSNDTLVVIPISILRGFYSLLHSCKHLQLNTSING